MTTYRKQPYAEVIARAQATKAAVVAAKAAPDIYAAARAVRSADPIFGKTWQSSLRRAAALRRTDANLPAYRIEMGWKGHAAALLVLSSIGGKDRLDLVCWSYVN